MRRMFGVIMLAAAAGTLIPAAAAMAGVRSSPGPGMQRFGVRLVDVPVSEAHNPRGLRYIIDFLHSGTVIHRRIYIENLEAHPVTFGVYPDAAKITRGSFVGDAGRTRSELTRWVSLAHPTVKLAPHGHVMDMVTIRVPRDATRGEHYGVVWVQQVSRGRDSKGVTIREIARVGIRIYLAVGKGGAPPTRYAITSITGHLSPRGRRSVTAEVHDTGGRAIDVSGTVTLTNGPGGISATAIPLRQALTLAPGQSDRITFYPSRSLPLGSWLATVRLVSGITRVKASATISFSSGPATAAWVAPASVTGAAGLAAGAFLLLRRFRVRRVRAPGGLRA